MITSMASTLANFRGPLIKRLADSGIRVYALAPDHTGRTRAAIEALGAKAVDISLDRTGMRPLRDLADFFRLYRQLRKLRPDAAFSYFIKPVIYGSLAARLAGIQRRYALVAGLGYVFTPGPDAETWRRRLLRSLVDRLYAVAFSACKRVFFQNPDDIAHFTGRGLIAPGTFVLVNGSGIDLTYYSPVQAVAEPVTFLLMSRLLREKGIGEFVDAARRVRETHSDARFLLLGALDPNPGGLRREEAEAWVREGIIEWAGHVHDVRPWIAQSSVYVLPSYREGLPRSTQEAMAMARPVITTDVPGCRETVLEGVNGFLVPLRDAEALAAAMRRFLEEPALIEAMGQASRRLAEERFDVTRINATMLAALDLAELTAGVEENR